MFLNFCSHTSRFAKLGIVQICSKSQNILITWTTSKLLHPHIDTFLFAQIQILWRLALRLGKMPSLPQKIYSFQFSFLVHIIYFDEIVTCSNLLFQCFQVRFQLLNFIIFGFHLFQKILLEITFQLDIFSFEIRIPLKGFLQLRTQTLYSFVGRVKPVIKTILGF